jgi:hypothetical protein
MVVGFYLPWLVGLELWLRSERGRRPDARQA